MDKHEKVLQDVEDMTTSLYFAIVSTNTLPELESLMKDVRVSKDKLKAIKKEIPKKLKEKFNEVMAKVEDLATKIQEKIDLAINSDI